MQSDDTIKLVWVCLFNRLCNEYACIVDKHLHLPALLLAAVCYLASCIRQGKVQAHIVSRNRIPACKLARKLLYRFTIDVNQKNAIPLFCKLKGIAPPHA